MTTPYFPQGVQLSLGQKRKLKRALKNDSEVTILLKKNQLSGNDQMNLTQSQIKKLDKAKKKKTGVKLQISKSQIKQAVEGNLLTSLAAIGAKALPAVTKFIPKVAAPLATGALSALGSLGVDKLFGSGGFLIPGENVGTLLINKALLTRKQKEDLLNALNSGAEVLVRPSEKQMGEALGTLLASIGIPMLLQALTGKGLSVPKRKSGKGRGRLQVPQRGSGLMVFPRSGLMPWMPPPVYGTWPEVRGRGKKIFSGCWTFPRRKQSVQQYPPDRRDSLKPEWKDVPLSNFDLQEWVSFLKIPDFKGVFSRDSVDHLHREGSCIINLDDGIGPRTHRVGHFIKGNVCFYFDSFSMPPPVEFMQYAEQIGKEVVYNGGRPIQEISSVRCGYYVLYFLKEIQKKSFYDVLKVFSLKDPRKNEAFIKKYFTH